MSDFFPTKPDRRYPSTCHLFAGYHIPINSKRTITVRKYPSKVFPKMPHLVLRIPRTCGQSQPKLPSNVGRAKMIASSFWPSSSACSNFHSLCCQSLPKVDMGLFSGENTNGFGSNSNPFLPWYGYSRSVQDLRSSQLVKHTDVVVVQSYPVTMLLTLTLNLLVANSQPILDLESHHTSFWIT